MLNKSLHYLSLFCLLFLCACQNDEAVDSMDKSENIGLLEGQVYYLERMMLAPGAELIITLEDVSRMDVVSTLVASTSMTLEGAPPYSFSLEYDTNLIQPKMSYSIRAKIMQGDSLLMTSSKTLNPFVKPQESIVIQVSSVGKAAVKKESVQAVTGLAVVSVNPLASLSNTYWKLMAIDGEEVVMGEKQQREAFFQLNDADASLKGFAGCNQFSGAFNVNGNDLSFGPIAATRKACAEGMEREADFFQILDSTAYYSIHEHDLTLLNHAKKPIALFQAQYFN